MVLPWDSWSILRKMYTIFSLCLFSSTCSVRGNVDLHEHLTEKNPYLWQYKKTLASDPLFLNPGKPVWMTTDWLSTRQKLSLSLNCSQNLLLRATWKPPVVCYDQRGKELPVCSYSIWYCCTDLFSLGTFSLPRAKKC